jgi:hypothetical protein
MLTNLVARLFPALRGASASARVHSLADFRGYLRRECIRADRTGRELSLVVLTPSPSGTSALLDLLGRRLRETDEIGWMEGGSVGALLTDTGRDGAHLVAGEVRGWSATARRRWPTPSSPTPAIGWPPESPPPRPRRRCRSRPWRPPSRCRPAWRRIPSGSG